jgi:riboflavin kinase/FMN adenylyltransferase
VHRGHQAVLGEAVAQARARGLACCVLTFDPHPGAVVGVGAPPLLATMERRAELMAALGIDRVYVRRFDVAFAAYPPERFARELVAATLRARLVVVGENFRFGARRSGDLGLLRALGQELGFEVRVHAVARDERGPFSSTRAREAVATGALPEATHVLGRPHALSGVVAGGDRRGRTIGFPTANLEQVPELLPPDGVYAVTVTRIDAAAPHAGTSLALGQRADSHAGTSLPLGGGVMNIGVRPTVGGGRRTVEVHVLGFDGDLYGARLRVDLVARLRGEQRFKSLDELKAQIARDVVAARAHLP